MIKTRVVRIPVDLDLAIRDLAKKNNMKYVEAGKEIANINKKFKNKIVVREIKW